MIRLGSMLLAAAAGGLIAFPDAAAAQSETAAEIRLLRAELEALRAEVAELKAAQARPPGLAAVLTPPPAAPTASAPAVPGESRLGVSGDFRLRWESNFGQEEVRDRNRAVLRARLRGSYALTERLTLAGQLDTGDPDDPNSTDVTLSNFVDDLPVSLDQAYARLTTGSLQLTGGKIPLPFARTDLVWDADVNPQGVSAAYRTPLGPGGELRFSGLYFIIDEAPFGRDSDMVGLQAAAQVPLGRSVRLDLAAAYYDYGLGSVAGADAGDFRTNALGPDGRYLSDFELVDLILAAEWRGLGDRWPVRLSADHVRNLGALGEADTGYAVDLLVGGLSRPGSLRFGYSYALAETDAVLAAFAQDNLPLGSNYRQHALSVDYAVRTDVLLNATLYRFRQDAAVSGEPAELDWSNRLRLNLLFNF